MGSAQSNKVPEVTAVFWIIKILATTLGETGGDAVSMSLGFGYLWGTVLFAAAFVVAAGAQMRIRTFNPIVYWLAIVATTTVGTTLADFVDRSLGIGYPGGVVILVTLLAASLIAWRAALGTIAVGSIDSPRAEAFYWGTILFSQTLGTALGDWVADSLSFGYAASALIFGSLLVLVAAAYFWSAISRTILFWTAFILTRPLGAVVGDWLDKPRDHGGLALSRYDASLVLFVAIALMIAIFSQKPAARAH